MTDVPAPPPPLATGETALLMVDMQNGFLHPDGWTSRLFGGVAPPLVAALEPARRTLAAARSAGVPVIHTEHAWEAHYADGGFLIEEMFPRLFAGVPEEDLFDLVRGTWEAEFLAGLTPLPGEHVIRKNRYDAFLATSLEQVLTRLNVRTLVVAGVVTTVCVESTVRSAAMRDYRVYLVGDAIGDTDQAVHDEGLARLGRLFGHVVPSAEVTTAWAPDAG